jgi:hypothetical protein
VSHFRREAWIQLGLTVGVVALGLVVGLVGTAWFGNR